MKYSILFLVLSLYGMVTTSQAAVIDFNDMSTTPGQTLYIEDGFQLQADTGSFKNLGNDFAQTANQASFLTLTQLDNTAFSFSSIVFNTLLPNTGKDKTDNFVTFKGYDGSSLIAEQTYTESDISANNTLLTFDTSFQSVTSVTWGNDRQISFDSIAVNPVAAIPEPSTYAMMLIGLALIGFMAKHRKAA